MIKNLELRSTYENAMTEIFNRIDSFPWNDRPQYGAWLAQSFHLTKFTTRVAALTAGRFALEEDALHIKGLRHLKEELGHENLALKDLKNLGFSINDYSEFLDCKLMIQSQYYFIQRHPSAHFGFVLPLETIACDRGPFIAQKVRESFGTLSDSFIRIHAEVDPHHVEAMINMINESPQWTWPLIQENLRQTGLLYSKMLERAALGLIQAAQAA